MYLSRGQGHFSFPSLSGMVPSHILYTKHTLYILSSEKKFFSLSKQTLTKHGDFQDTADPRHGLGNNPSHCGVLGSPGARSASQMAFLGRASHPDEAASFCLVSIVITSPTRPRTFFLPAFHRLPLPSPSQRQGPFHQAKQSGHSVFPRHV